MEHGYDPEYDNKNYYGNAQTDYSGLRDRLEGDSRIKHTIRVLKGGVAKDANGRVIYNDDFRMMNDLGISRAIFHMLSCVNKITHLTKFENEERIYKQIRPLAIAWIKEITLNRKLWQVKNSRLVIQHVENAMFQSMLRGEKGFEASLTGKSWHVGENITHGEKKTVGGVFAGLGNREE